MRAGTGAFNFNAGPSALPLPVLERIRAELMDYRGTGMSVMEMSHRSPEYEEIQERAEKVVRRLLGVPEDYAVIFLQGGGSMQFAMVPMNLFLSNKPVDMLHTGTWTAKAMAELRKIGSYRLAAPEIEKFVRLPAFDEMTFDSNASYVYLASNNTIEGTQWTAFPDSGKVPIVADMSSDILSRPVDVRRFGLIFAGAQKNLGPAGATLVILRRDLAERADQNLPAILQYRTHIKEHSLYHTPPTFAVYVMGLVLEWIEAQGGLREIQSRNEVKASLLYETIDQSELYTCPVEKASRSKMNVVFWLNGKGKQVEEQFLERAAAEGFVGLAGHRSVGGIRASLYNAVPLEAVRELVRFMSEFERTTA